MDNHSLAELPDILLPSQFFESIGEQTYSSEQRLLFAILIDAINLVRDCRVSSSDRKRLAFNEASSWLFDRHIDGPMSFEHVCDALGVDAESLRSRLSQLVSERNGSSLARLRLKEAGRIQRIIPRRDRRLKGASSA